MASFFAFYQPKTRGDLLWIHGSTEKRIVRSVGSVADVKKGTFMYIISKTEQASLNFEDQYNKDPSFRGWLTAGHKGQGIDTSVEPNQVRIYQGKDGAPLGYIVIYGEKGCLVVRKENFPKFQKAMAWYMTNPTKLCYRYTDEDGFESQEDMNRIFEDPRLKAIKDQAKAMTSH